MKAVQANIKDTPEFRRLQNDWGQLRSELEGLKNELSLLESASDTKLDRLVQIFGKDTAQKVLNDLIIEAAGNRDYLEDVYSIGEGFNWIAGSDDQKRKASGIVTSNGSAFRKLLSDKHKIIIVDTDKGDKGKTKAGVKIGLYSDGWKKA